MMLFMQYSRPLVLGCDIAMWYYLWAHSVYHLVRWFPQNNRVKIFCVMMFFTLFLLFPQFYVLLQSETTRWCDQPLFELLIVSVVFTFFVIGFTFLFMIMIPVPREVKIAFHIFGFVTFIEGLVSVALVSKAEDCKSSTEGLYYISVAMSWLAVASIVFFAIMLPFWMINKCRREAVLNKRDRTGICYEPVKCCNCLWHI